MNLFGSDHAIFTEIAEDFFHGARGFFNCERLHVVNADIGDLASHCIPEHGDKSTVLQQEKLPGAFVGAGLEGVPQGIR